PKKKVLRDMMRETYLNAQEAVDYGLVHEII
ncbi:MAG: ATP-dependent Clp protease proteolytic subunit, partial [Parcubacteria group bacterium CG10_big_fil_rev_8_21_14_0_10_36_14]